MRYYIKHLFLPDNIKSHKYLILSSVLNLMQF
jgi:hypothetical protein